MPIPSETAWKTSTSRWWARRSSELVAVDTAIGLYDGDKTHERFMAIAKALRNWMESKDGWRQSTRNVGLNRNVVTDLVDTIAASDYWRGVRDGTADAALADYFRAASRSQIAAPNTFNREFLTDPESFLRTYFVYCYNKESCSQELGTYNINETQLGGRQAIGFEFVKAEKVGTAVCLNISPQGLGGENIINAGWIPYRGQSPEPEPDRFGHLAILSAEYDFIFTVGLGGCRIAVVRGHVINMYHEPTQSKWSGAPNYDGELISYCSPDYDDYLAGFCCFQKTATGWRSLVQEFGMGGSVERLTITDIAI